MELMNLIFGFSRGRYPLDRDALQDVFVEGLESLGYDGHGIQRIQDKDLIPAHDDLFAVHSYWWGDEDAPEARRPNFAIPSKGIEVRWYKYALRDAYANVDLSPDEWRAIFAELSAELVRRGLDLALIERIEDERSRRLEALLEGPETLPS